MKAINPYLTFDGNAREAMTFYADALDAELSLQTFRETGNDAPGVADRVMHAKLTEKGSSSGTMAGAATVIMASDSQPNDTVNVGNNIWLTIDCTDAPEQDRIFKALSAGGNVVMGLQDTFWGARFGMLKDKFGIGWMLNCELRK